MLKIFFFLLILLSTQGTVLAQDADTSFNIRIFGGLDTEAPSTPVLSATTSTSFQTDLAWSTSTDNFSVAGYRVFRDGDIIATTSLQSYADIGLSPSTTYAYQVQAFDGSFNFSSTSNTATVTTPNLPAPVVTEPEQGTAARVVARELLVESGLSTTSISLLTAFPARIELRWGRTDSYELGYVVSSVFKRENDFFLEELEPGTTYTYEIVGYTPLGQETVLTKDTFTTQSVRESIPPANVNRFVATANGPDVNLSWSLPAGVDAQFVRIVRSHLDFPQFTNDGAIVYQGLADRFVDEDILNTYSPVYYTAFLYDQFGNVSSGAVAIVYASGDGQTDDRPVTEVQISDQSTSTINQDRLTPLMKMPEPSEIVVKQGSETYTMFDAPLEFNNAETILVQIPTDSIAGNLKSIIATVVDPTDNKKTYSFLLRINRDRSAYEANLTNLGVVGQSQLRLEIYDFETYVVAEYQTPIVFSEFLPPRDRVVFPDVFFDHINLTLLGIVLSCSAVLVFLLIWRRWHEDNR